ncbi:MAG: hypothetical protein QM817_41025 [Archangium sp.]
MRIRTNDVVAQLRLSYAAEAKALAGTNKLISRAEATKVGSDDLRGAITALVDGQPGVRLNVDMVVDEAVKRALERLNSVNTTGPQYVSKAEVDAIKKKLPDLGNRFAAAYDAVKGTPTQPAVDPQVMNAVKTALTPWAGGTLPPLDVRLISQTPAGPQVEVDIHRNDGQTVTARLTATARGPDAIQILTDAQPVTGPVVAGLERTLQQTTPGARVVGYVERTDIATGQSEVLTAWKNGRAVQLSNIKGDVVTPATLGSADEATARTLALMMARFQARELVNQDPEPGSILEYHLRTAAAKPGDLKRITKNADSPVGFDPASDAFQFQLSRVWGDNSVFVTLGKNGAARLEDFN